MLYGANTLTTKECRSDICHTQPATLFSQCINLIAHHLDIVDSFVGFPSQIGEKIFSVGLQTGRFVEEKFSSQCLQLFADAFGQDLLSSLNMSGEYLGLNFYLEQILLFEHLTHLDISNCGLGDDHEIIAHFSKLNCLKLCDLSDNGLSDNGIRQMTTPYRMFGHGPSSLTGLSLAHNVDVSAASLKYVTKFPCLTDVDLSGCHKCRTCKCGEWTLDYTDTPPHYHITTEGWASSLIDTWMKTAVTKSKEKKPKSNFFYCKKVIAADEEVNIKPPKSTEHLIATRRIRSLSSIPRSVESSLANKEPFKTSDKDKSTTSGTHSPDHTGDITDIMDIYKQESASSTAITVQAEKDSKFPSVNVFAKNKTSVGKIVVKTHQQKQKEQTDKRIGLVNEDKTKITNWLAGKSYKMSCNSDGDSKTIDKNIPKHQNMHMNNYKVKKSLLLLHNKRKATPSDLSNTDCCVSTDENTKPSTSETSNNPRKRKRIVLCKRGFLSEDSEQIVTGQKIQKTAKHEQAVDVLPVKKTSSFLDALDSY